MPSSIFRAPATAVPPPPPADQVRAVRRFNRFFTGRIGVLEPYLGSDLSLTEVRVLYELAHADPPVAARDIGHALGLDAGYLSRILRRFDQAGWLARSASPGDGRQQLLALTSAGHTAFAPLQQQARDAAASLLARMAPPRRLALVEALAAVESLLGSDADADADTAPVLRPHRAGDIGWVVEQHGLLYAQEYGWTAEFEALVAGICAKFLRDFDPTREHCWIAEQHGRRVGCVFLCAKSKTVAQLRMLLLTPDARGLGLGGQLVDACIAFARARSGAGGYRKLALWTNRNLDAARALYASRGFACVKSAPYRGFGHDLVGETWELRL